MAAPLPPPAGLAAGVGGAFGGGVAVTPLAALQVAHALVELRGVKTSVADVTVARAGRWMNADQGGVTHRQVQTRSPEAPVRRQHVPLPQNDGSNSVQSDSSLAAVATYYQQHG